MLHVPGACPALADPGYFVLVAKGENADNNCGENEAQKAGKKHVKIGKVKCFDAV